ncbi:hypothetical protein ACFCV8_07320 [Streptomyces sp. NPDC056347]|uniref:hypothetical protein n=1 Tax=Streptomyces sp. NPDC056347 TaxID=3345790 RepID=UPI0035D6D781
MTEQLITPERDGLREAVVERGDVLRDITLNLLAAFEHLGAEHQALVVEEKETKATERRGTVRRMIHSIVDVSRLLAYSVDEMAKAYGLRELGIDRQMAKGVDGCDYSPLLTVGGPGEALGEAASYVEAAVDRLEDAYRQTKKYPALAVARRPREMRAVLSSLREALTGLSTELDAYGLAGGDEVGPFIAILNELETRVCSVVPAQPSGLTADAVTAAILTDPEIASAAAAALARTDP